MNRTTFVTLFLCFVSYAFGHAQREKYLKDLDPSTLQNINPEFLASWDEEKPLPYDWPCPKDDDILPCICTSNLINDFDLNCDGIQDDSEISKVFQVHFPFLKIREFRIVHQQPTTDSINTLKAGVFQDKKFDIVTIQGTNLSIIEEEVFTESHDSLSSLNLDRNNLANFPFESLNLYINFNIFSLNHNLLTTLPQIDSASLTQLYANGNQGLKFDVDVFKKLPSLETISLEGIDLKRVLPHLFEGIETLKVIKLGLNKLTTLEEFAINTGGLVIDLRFEYNEITSIYHDAISGMDPKGYFDFSHNQIIDLEESSWKKTFEEVANAETINLEGNPLRCGCEIYWIKKDPVIDSKITRTTACFDNTKFHDLDLNFFIHNC